MNEFIIKLCVIFLGGYAMGRGIGWLERIMKWDLPFPVVMCVCVLIWVLVFKYVLHI